MKESALFKGVIVGDEKVGKTSFLSKLVNQSFTESYLPTIGVDFYKLNFTLPSSKKDIAFQLWDTSGQPRFQSITNSYYRGAHFFIVFYDITSESSFARVNDHFKLIRDFGAHNTLITLIGNKKDLAQHQREVTVDEGEDSAIQNEAFFFFEVSSKMDDNLIDIIYKIADKLVSVSMSQSSSEPRMSMSSISAGKAVPLQEKLGKSADSSVDESQPPVDPKTFINVQREKKPLENSKSPIIFKFLLVGDATTGKSAILKFLSNLPFSEAYVSTIGVDFITYMFVIDDEAIKLQIWDTSGQERFATITSAYYRGADVIFVVYDVSSQSSFAQVSAYFHNIQRMASSDCLTVLLANKLDVGAENFSVHPDVGKRTADELKAMFFEISAKTGENVKETFRCVAEARYKQRLVSCGGLDPVPSKAVIGMVNTWDNSSSEDEQEKSSNHEKVERKIDVSFKVLLLGNAASGKSVIVKDYLDESGKDEKSCGKKFVQLNNGTAVELQVLDILSDNGSFSALKDRCQNSQAAIVVYDVMDIEEGLSSAKTYFMGIENHCNRDVLIILVGCLKKEQNGNSNNGISAQEGRHLALTFGALFFEANLGSGEGIEKVFSSVATSLASSVTKSQTSVQDSKALNSRADFARPKIGGTDGPAQLHVSTSSLSRIKTSNKFVRVKLILLGSADSGKTSLVNRIADDSFTTSYKATIGVDFKKKKVETKEGAADIALWDTAGQERFRSISTSYYRGMDLNSIALLVYDITNRETFDAIENFHRSLLLESSGKPVLVLVGTKIDLADKRQVTVEEGRLLSQRLGALFFETSAKDGSNVDYMMHRITSELLSRTDDVSSLETEEYKENKKSCLCTII